MKKFLIIPAVLFNVVLAMPVHAEHAATSLEKLVSELAEKPEHHKAIANYYKDKAATARADAAEHRRMGAMPVGHSKSPLAQQNWRNHCEKLAKELDSVAMEYDELAKLHAETQ